MDPPIDARFVDLVRVAQHRAPLSGDRIGDDGDAGSGSGPERRRKLTLGIEKPHQDPASTRINFVPHVGPDDHRLALPPARGRSGPRAYRSEEHTSELQSL